MLLWYFHSLSRLSINCQTTTKKGPHTTKTKIYTNWARHKLVKEFNNKRHHMKIIVRRRKCVWHSIKTDHKDMKIKTKKNVNKNLIQCVCVYVYFVHMWVFLCLSVCMCMFTFSPATTPHHSRCHNFHVLYFSSFINSILYTIHIHLCIVFPTHINT